MNFFLLLCLGVVHLYPCAHGQVTHDGGDLSYILAELKNLKNTVKDLKKTVTDLQSENKELVSKIHRLEDDKRQNANVNTYVSKGKIESVPIVDDQAQNVSYPFHALVKKDKKTNIHARRIRQIADARVAFSASLSTGADVNLGDHHTVIYNNVFTNIGSAYHPHTGIFIAPYKGAYVFSTKMMSPQGKDMYLEIVRDGNFVDYIYADSKSSHDWVSATKEWILEVNKGSEVWIRARTQGQLHGFSHSMFSGFLLFETE